MGSVHNGKAGTTSQSQFKMEPQAKHRRYDNKDNKAKHIRYDNKDNKAKHIRYDNKDNKSLRTIKF